MSVQPVEHEPVHALMEAALSDGNPSAGGNGARPLPFLFEIAWEVCSQTGGIYTVLRSKAPAAVRRWGDQYWLIGPYWEAAAKIEFEAAPAVGVVGEAIEKLRERGILIHSGRWLITGRPQVLLVDVNSRMGSLGEMKYLLWKDLGIGTPGGDTNVDETISFGYTVADFLGEVHQRLSAPMLAHFHEWQGSVALPLLKFRQVRFPTVFTTHATLVGRSLSAANVQLYDHLSQIDGGAVAREHGFEHRYNIERAAAHAADVFTTVSDITAMEAAQFLGRRPEAVLPNGLNVERFAAPYEFQNLHRQCKDLIHEFVMGHFFPSYTFDLDRTIYMFSAGRYEYRNKGFDVFIEALYELNQRLRAQPLGVTVVAFIIAPAPAKGLNMATLRSQAMFNELRDTCESIEKDVGRKLFRTVAEGRLPTVDDLLDEYAKVRLKRMMHAWRQFMPTIVTHDLVDDAHDPILCHLRHRHLLNSVDDPVKVVFHPEFITTTSPLFGLEYDQFVRGCNIGVFPSYYEPWGYTPMECVVRGIPAITSDLSGFGAHVMAKWPEEHDSHGLFVARRRSVSFDYTVSQVASWLHALCRMSRRERIQLRNSVERHAESFDWSNMSQFYRAARRMAFEKYYPGQNIIPPPDETTDAPAQSADTARHATRRRAVRPLTAAESRAEAQ